MPELSANDRPPVVPPDGPSGEFPKLTSADLRSPRPRRVMLPVTLFLLTCLATFWSGVKHWAFFMPLSGGISYRWLVVAHWPDGLVYMASVIGILLAHELGHFIATLICGIPASLPYFIPWPLSPIGTMGAVIGMAGHRANRRQIFDIGIAGPLAGLVCLMPFLWLGITQLDLTIPRSGGAAFDCPWVMRLVYAWLRPEAAPLKAVWVSQLNPMFMAAWVGLFVTGLNMLPVSQLDGGHIIYALLRGRARYVSRAFLFMAIIYIVVAQAYIWLLMLILVVLIGIDHPPTANDDAHLGPFRIVLGWMSLLIPLLCFPPRGFITFF